MTVRLGELDGLSAEFIQKNGNQKGTIFYIHGGGFTVGSVRERRAVCQYITANYGYNCVTFNYRLAPENLWPAPLEDCLTAYTALLKNGVSPKNVVFMGESAGGTLVLSLALLLDDSKALYEKLKKQGHQTALDIRHGVCHAFQVFTAMPEARQAFAVVFRTLEEWI